MITRRFFLGGVAALALIATAPQIALTPAGPAVAYARAEAGSLTIGLASTPLTGSKTYTISDADATKLIAYVQGAYPTRANPAYDPSCNPVPGPCAAATLANTAAQSLAAWADGIVAGTVANVQNAQKASAADTATKAVTPVTIQ